MTPTTLDSLNFVLRSPDFTELVSGLRFSIDLRYASANNFVGRDMYGVFNRAFLHQRAAEQLDHAWTQLQKESPGARFLIFDALRPRSIQRVLWAEVVGTANQSYIANPDQGSLHNFGFAVDLSVLDERGRELDMGAGFDDFRPIAQPKHEAEFLAQGLLTRAQHENRLLLRRAMEAAGFAQLPHEWWHFDALPRTQVREGFTIVE